MNTFGEYDLETLDEGSMDIIATQLNDLEPSAFSNSTLLSHDVSNPLFSVLDVMSSVLSAMETNMVISACAIGGLYVAQKIISHTTA